MSEKKKAYIFDVYDDYEIRLRYVRDVFAEKGYQVTMYLSDFDHFHKEKYKTKQQHLCRLLLAFSPKRFASYNFMSLPTSYLNTDCCLLMKNAY